MNITSQDVSEWMIEQLAIAHVANEYAHLQVNLYALRDSATKTPRFNIYHSMHNKSSECGSFEECFEEIRGLLPLNQAQAKRAQAAALLAQAEELEASA